MMRHWSARLGVLALVATSTVAHTQTLPVASVPAPRPKLVIAIAVDQFAAELYARYKNRFTGGFKRLGSGIAFTVGYQSHAATETCPGHSTLLTGMHPSHTGIVANNWFDRQAGTSVYCVGVAGTADPDARGPQNLKTSTYGEWLKQAQPGARVVGVSSKDRAAIMMAGHHPDAVYWWADGVGWATSSFAGPVTPQVTGPAKSFNHRLFTTWRAAPPSLWPTKPTADCQALATPHVFGQEQISGHVPPEASLAVESGPDFIARTDFHDQLRASPTMDPVTLDFAYDLIEQDRLGRGPATDLLAISLSATDYIGHRYGNGGAEMCAHLHVLDAALGRFLDRVDATGVPYLVVLTADHGGIDAPERLKDQGVTARRIDGAAVVRKLNDYLKKTEQLGYEPIEGSDAQQLVINIGNAPAEQRRKLSADAVAWLKAQPEVAQVFTSDEVAAATPISGETPDRLTLAQRFNESFDPKRSGDIIVSYQPLATSGIPRGPGDYVAGHGSPYDYDRQVPILWWWSGAPSAERQEPAETVDIAPTLAAITGVPTPPVDGRCRPEVTVCR